MAPFQCSVCAFYFFVMSELHESTGNAASTIEMEIEKEQSTEKQETLDTHSEDSATTQKPKPRFKMKKYTPSKTDQNRATYLKTSTFKYTRFPALTRAECNTLLNSLDSITWQHDRHDAFRTTDVALDRVGCAWVFSALHDRVLQPLALQLGA